MKINIIIYFLICINILYSANLENIKEKLNDINSGIYKNTKNILKVSAKEKNTLVNIKKLEKEIKTIKLSYTKTKKKYDKLVRRVDYEEQKLKTIENEAKIDIKDLYDKLLVLYKHSQKDILQVPYILAYNSDDIYNLKLIIKQDREDLLKMNKIRNDINLEKEIIEAEKNKMTNIKKDLYTKKKSLKLAINKKNKLIANMREQKAYYAYVVKNLKSEKENLENLVKRILTKRQKQEKGITLTEAEKKIGHMSYPVRGTITTRYKDMKKNDFGISLKSSGIEIKSHLGARVKAGLHGKVIYSEAVGNLGYVIIIDHGFGISTVYGNLIMSYVKLGETVKKNQNIGVLGLDEDSKEPKLYLEVRLNAKTVDPFLFLKKRGES